MKGFFSSSPKQSQSKSSASDEVSSFASDNRTGDTPSPSRQRRPPSMQDHHSSALPMSMQLLRPFAGSIHSCQECGALQQWPPPQPPSSTMSPQAEEDTTGDNLLAEYERVFASFPSNRSCVSPMVVAPMMYSTNASERIITEYIAACRFYGCSDRVNAGVLATFRFSLPSLRVTGDFHNADMLALADVMIRHANGPLRYIQRLDFGLASKEGKLHGKRGFQSHGALALAKILQASEYIQELRLSRHKVGPYGASAIFLAASRHLALRVLIMRRCRIMERGGMAFAELICRNAHCRLEEVDLSCNHIGLRGSIAIEQELSGRSEKASDLVVDLEGNLVFQEIMNGITHGLGIVLAFVGSVILSNRVKHLSRTHVVSCAVYSTSLLVLYTSSTLYHSFFSMQHTKYIFEVLDKCAIYILIAGSYTPFLQVVLGHEKLWSVYLLAFIWTCCLCGITVEAFFPIWNRKDLFSLAMYLGMGWSCVVCLPELVGILPQPAMNLLVLGGVGYTAGVPFFVRNHNLDHTIFHCFVLAGSIFHWIGIYHYLPTIHVQSTRG